MHAFYSQLTADCLLHFTGGQVPTFLQGQLTCDCLAVSATQSTPGALCSAQGRVVTDCRVLQLDENHFALRLAREVRDTTHDTLKKYAMFSRTQISERDDAWALLGVWGTDAAAALQATVGAVPAGRDSCARTDDLVACQADDSGEAFELVVTVEALPAVLDALSTQARERPEADWQQDELRRGIIRTTADLSGDHVPQVLNYDLAGLLNFRKGCYIGQEVVARLHYRGKSKRRCGVYAAAPGAAVETGAGLVSPDSDRKVGSVLRAIAADGKDTLFVALVTVDDSEQPLAVVDTGGDGALLQPVALPYSVRGSSEAS
ncbi:MAG: hypothetical protein RIC38_11270 [Chromatocurvus sp.]